MKRSPFILSSLLLIMLLSSCSANRTATLNRREKMLVGTWHFEKVTRQKAFSFKKGDRVTNEYLNDLITFNADRTVQLLDKKTGTVIAKGVWEVEHDIAALEGSTPDYHLKISLLEAPERIGPKLKGTNFYIWKKKLVFHNYQDKEVTTFKLTRTNVL